MPSNRIGYGYGTYSDADYGTEGVIQTGSASISASCTVVANGGIRKDASASDSVATSAITASATRIRESDALVSSTAVTTSLCEEFILKIISEYDYGDGAYGYASYGQGPLDTVSTGSASSTGAATRVRIASATSTASASTASSGLMVFDGVAQADASTTTAADSVVTAGGSATVSAVAQLTCPGAATFASSGLVSSTSSISSLAREKWEKIAVNQDTWVKIA